MPAIYVIFSRKPLRPVDIGNEVDIDAVDSAEFIEQMGDDAKETYEYESWRERRLKLSKA